MECSSSIIVSDVHINLCLHLESFDTFKVTQGTKMKKILGDIHFSSPPLSQSLVMIDLEVMKIIVLANQLTKLNPFRAISILIKWRSVSANAHDPWDNDHNGSTDPRFCW